MKVIMKIGNKYLQSPLGRGEGIGIDKYIYFLFYRMGLVDNYYSHGCEHFGVIKPTPDPSLEGNS